MIEPFETITTDLGTQLEGGRGRTLFTVKSAILVLRKKVLKTSS